MVFTETFTTEPIDITGYYGMHAYGKKTEGRPMGGVSCYMKPTLGSFKIIHKDENILVIQTELIAVIAVYIRPQATSEEVIETIGTAVVAAEKQDKIIILGDINCRIDKKNTKTEIVMEMLREEGFKLANSKEMPTYIAHNGTSAIDLVLYRGKEIKLIEQKGLWSSSMTPVRKHIPIATTLDIATEGRRKEKEGTRKSISRIVNQEKIRQSQNLIEDAREKIREEQLDTALNITNDVIRHACHPTRKRWAQPWFDKTCYEARRITLKALSSAKDTRRTEDLEQYAKMRKQYKTILKDRRDTYMEEEARRTAEEAERNPFLPMKRKTYNVTKEIPMEKWENHFSRILNKANENKEGERSTHNNPRTPGQEMKIKEEEVAKYIGEAKNKKATGPDQIAYEHLKATADMLKKTWTELFNKCLSTGTVPEQWRRATLKILYKGKGSTDDMNSYRGVALENTSFKIFMKIITNRLTELTEQYIPENQFGFRKGKSTLQAATELLRAIEEATSKPKGKYYAVFIDYEKAFDCINRRQLIRKVNDMVGSEHPIARIIEDIMRQNWILINDDITTSNDIKQTNGVMQGDPVSPLLFNIMTADIGKNMKGKLIMYADDMVLGSENKEEVQDDLNSLQRWAEKNNFTINKGKTVQMVFRRGGRVATNDKLKLKEEPLRIVNKFKYLGITVQPTAKSYSVHIQERTSAAIRAMCKIRNITTLKLETAMRLFETVITPIATYGIEIIWDKLSTSDLQRMEKVKARFLKRALAAGKYAPNRMMYMLARETYFLEDLRFRLLLPPTEAYRKAISQRRQKEREIESSFFATDAMVNRDWTGSNQSQRYAIIGLTVHGFHHKMCINTKFHQPSEQCVCKICEQACERYHFHKCKKRTGTLNDLIKST